IVTEHATPAQLLPVPLHPVTVDPVQSVRFRVTPVPPSSVSLQPVAPAVPPPPMMQSIPAGLDTTRPIPVPAPVSISAAAPLRAGEPEGSRQETEFAPPDRQ